MKQKLIDLTSKLIKIQSVSSLTNKELIYFVIDIIKNDGFKTEILEYNDPKGIKKYNLIAHRGINKGGLAFLIHSDTVPFATEDQKEPKVIDGKLYGRGACDMKGPMAAAILAITETDKPITIIITSDEEIGCIGAEYVAKNSKLLKEFKPEWGVATEPTELKPIYSHKGILEITITAYGKAAHSSTNVGDNANLKMAPFIYYISKLKEKYDSDKTYQNPLFTPPTNTLNLTFSDFNCAPNVTAAKSRCKICIRIMPNARTEDVLKEILNEAKNLELEASYVILDSLHTDPALDIVSKAKAITGNNPETVAYLTDASMFSKDIKSIILGPGSIKQAHTKDEYINIDELYNGYKVYKKIIEAM